MANTAACLHVLPARRATAGGKADRVVRVQVTTPAGSLKQEQRAGIATDLTAAVAELSGQPGLRERTWVIFHEAVDGGWGDAVRASLKR